MTDRTFIFFDVNQWSPQFKFVGILKQANDIINSSGGQLYFRELKDKKLIVADGPHKGEDAPEKLNKYGIELLQIEEEI